MNTLKIISLGPGRGESLTLAALRALRDAPQVLLRTERTPVSAFLRDEGIGYTPLDACYEQADDFDALNGMLVQAVMEAADRSDVVYAVPDAASDQSVKQLLLKRPDAVILPGIGLFDAIRARHPDALLCPASDLPAVLGDLPLLIVEIDTALLAGELKLKLLDWYGQDCPCTWYPPAEGTDRLGQETTLEMIDRFRAYDHTAALYLSPLPLTRKERYTFRDLVEIMRILRTPDGCPWDREQTHESLRPYLIEESYEVTQAIQEEDWDHVADELGDVLLQVVFQADIGTQYGTLTLSDITTAICSKMIRRHPHIFGHATADTSDAVIRNWEQIKRAERGQATAQDAMRDVPVSLPPLMRAQKALRKAKAAGLDRVSPENALSELRSLTDLAGQTTPDDPRKIETLGRLLFALVRVAGQNGVDCETALSDATERYIGTFMEK